MRTPSWFALAESIQAAIDGVANGGSIVIKPGTYLLQSSLIVSGKHVAIIGSGARGRQRTELVGPEPGVGAGRAGARSHRV